MPSARERPHEDRPSRTPSRGPPLRWWRRPGAAGPFDVEEARPVRAFRWSSALATMALTGCLLAACGSSSGSSQSITLYSGQYVQTTDSLVAGFEKATGITVNVRNDDEDTLTDEIVTEGSHSPADVIYTENSPALQFLQNKEL